MSMIDDTEAGGLLNDAAAIAMIHPDITLRMFRKMAKDRDIKPYQKCRDYWLWLESDIRLMKCLKSSKDQTAPIGKSRVRFKGSASERVRERLTRKPLKNYGSKENTKSSTA